MDFARSLAKWFLFGIIFAVLGAFVIAQPATAAGQGGNANNNQNGPNNNDSQPVLDLAKFTDVQALFAAIQKARTDANGLPRTGADRPHIEKAIESLNAALSDSFTANNIDNLFQNVRQAVQSLEAVKEPKAAAHKIASDLAEAIRAAVEKFLTNVERAIPRLADTKTRENATKDLAKSKDDYARGLALISSNRGAAINQFQQAMKRMVGYPLVSSVIPQEEKTDGEGLVDILATFPSGGTSVWADSSGVHFVNLQGNVITPAVADMSAEKYVYGPEIDYRVEVSASGNYFVVDWWDLIIDDTEGFIISRKDTIALIRASGEVVWQYIRTSDGPFDTYIDIPRPSRNGDMLVEISDDPELRGWVEVRDASGVVLSTLPRSVENFSWSNDGTRIFYEWYEQISEDESVLRTGVFDRQGNRLE